MSGYPYGNPPGGYPYPPGYAAPYPPAPMPPPVPQYGGNQSCAEYYGKNPPNSYGFASPPPPPPPPPPHHYPSHSPHAISSGFTPYPVAPSMKIYPSID
jgi:hypothetical protein